MVRTTLAADENSDVDAVLVELRSQFKGTSVSQPSLDLLTAQVKEILTQLVSHGRTLAAQGSQLKVTRDIEVEGYSVKLVFGAGVPQSGWRKFVNRIFRS